MLQAGTLGIFFLHFWQKQRFFFRCSGQTSSEAQSATCPALLWEKVARAHSWLLASF